MQTAANALSTWTPASLIETEHAPLAVVEAVFGSLEGQLGAKLADLYGGVPAETVKSEWAQGLAGFHPSELKRGLHACRSRVFAPTLGEFLRMCRPALDPEIGWLEAQAGMRERAAGGNGDWTHPAVYRAASGFEHELRSSSFRDQRKAWEWRLAREMARGWDEPEAPQSQLRLQRRAA